MSDTPQKTAAAPE
jgi:phenylalanyl-tRNA synthetase alpha chain